MSLSNNFDFAPIELGMISKHSMPSDNWVQCDGSTFSEEEYPDFYKQFSIVREKSVKEDSEYATDNNCNVAFEKRFNGKRIRVFALSGNQYGTTIGSNKIIIKEYNDSTQQWTDVKTIKLSNSYTNGTTSDYYYQITNVDLFYANGYYFLLFDGGVYNGNNWQYKYNYLTGTTLSGLASKGYFSTRSSNSGGYNLAADILYRDSKYYMVCSSSGSEGSVYQYIITPTTSYTEFPSQSGAYNYCGGVTTNIKTVYYSPHEKKHQIVWYRGVNGNQSIISSGTWKSGNSSYNRSITLENKNNANYGTRMSGTFLPIYYNNTVYLISTNGIMDQDSSCYRIDWSRTEGASSTKLSLSNIFNHTEAIWGGSVVNDKVRLVIGSVQEKAFNENVGFTSGKIIELPISDLISNNNSRIKNLKTLKYFAPDQYSYIGKQGNSNGIYTGYSVAGGGYAVNEDLTLSVNKFDSSYIVEEKKGELPNIKGSYIRVK